jgi:probable rRNA maturation factor
MNRAEVRAEEVPLPAWAGSLADFSVKALDALGKDNWDLSILLCGDTYIRKLNSQYRGRDEATDVLSFALGESCPDGEGRERYFPGDIVVSLETLEENSQYFEVSFDEELRRVIIHGILHLNGMDHAANGKDEPMLLLQEELLEKTKGGILPPETRRAGTPERTDRAGHYERG